MGKTFGWRSVLVVVAAACSGEQVTAPGVCPDFCTGTQGQPADTVLVGAVQGDSSFDGYVVPHRAFEMVVSTGGAVESRAILRFFRFADTIPINNTDTTTRPVLETDSLQMALIVGRRTADAADLRLAFYRLPPSLLDSATTYAQVAPFFDDSTFLKEVTLSPAATYDSLLVGIPFSALPNFVADTGRVAIGIALRSASPSYVALGTTEGSRGPILSRFVKVDSVPAVTVSRVVVLGTQMDTYVFPPVAPLPAGVLSVGGAPSSRTFVRFEIPPRILDSSNVVRATLLLTPASPILAPPGDTLFVVAHALASDIGPKSPLEQAIIDSTGLSGARVVSGQTDTVKVDITFLLRAWRADTTRSHSLVLRVSPEGSSFGEFRFYSTTDPLRRPVLDITYVPPLSYQGR